MSLIGKEVKSLKAIKGLDANAITAEHVDAINAELKDEFEIEGIEVSVKGTLQAAKDKATTAEAELATANENLTAKTSELEAANAKVTELTAKLENKPAANAAEPKVIEDAIKPVGGEGEDTFIEDLSNRIKAERGL